MFVASVASVAVHEIAAVACPANRSVNVPLVGVPPIVTVWTHDVPDTGVPEQKYGPPIWGEFVAKGLFGGKALRNPVREMPCVLLVTARPVGRVVEPDHVDDIAGR